MTQMMLFDTCSLTAAATSAPATAANPALRPTATTTRPTATTTRPTATTTRPATISSRPEAPQSDAGLHTMGDLARLVLLRYQLVAKRREEMAARQSHRPLRRS